MSEGASEPAIYKFFIVCEYQYTLVYISLSVFISQA